MSVREGEVAGRRRRRTPDAARAEIIEAAEGLLRERPFRELTVDEVMRRTGLSRPSFYVYFKDRNELLLRIVEHLATELGVVAGRWYGATGPGPELLRDALEGLRSVYAHHGAVLRALADASVDDLQVEQAYSTLQQGFIDATARHISNEIEAGAIAPLDPGEAAKAIIWMCERYLYHAYGENRSVPPEKVTETLHTLMVRMLYTGS